MADVAARTIAERFRVMQPSATVENTERIRAARASGRRILGLSSGDPNIVTDPRIIAAAERAMRGDKTHYSAPAGEPELRTAIAAREAERSGARYDPDDILVTPGGKFALLTALDGHREPGRRGPRAASQVGSAMGHACGYAAARRWRCRCSTGSIWPRWLRPLPREHARSS